MNLKFFIRGIGVGIVLTAIVIFFMKTDIPQISDQEIMKRAEELGMEKKDDPILSILEQAEKDKNKINLDKKNDEVKDEKEPIKNENENENNKPTELEEENDLIENNHLVENNNPLDEVEEIDEERKTYSIVIKPGMNSTDVSSILYEKGLIDDKSAFNKYMTDNEMSEIIKIGEFEIFSGSTFAEIGKTISR